MGTVALIGLGLFLLWKLGFLVATLVVAFDKSKSSPAVKVARKILGAPVEEHA